MDLSSLKRQKEVISSVFHCFGSVNLYISCSLQFQNTSMIDSLSSGNLKCVLAYSHTKNHC